MTTLPMMGLDLPVRGAPGSGVWDDTLDADLALIDSHNHSTGQGTAVPTAGININADLTFGGLWAPIHLHPGKPESRMLGCAFRKVQDRPVSGKVLRREDLDGDGIARWAVHECG